MSRPRRGSFEALSSRQEKKTTQTVPRHGGWSRNLCKDAALAAAVYILLCVIPQHYNSDAAKVDGAPALDEELPLLVLLVVSASVLVAVS